MQRVLSLLLRHITESLQGNPAFNKGKKYALLLMFDPILYEFTSSSRDIFFYHSLDLNCSKELAVIT